MKIDVELLVGYIPIPPAPAALAAFFAFIFSHFSAAVIFFLFCLLTPLSMLFDIITSVVYGDWLPIKGPYKE
ncbi:MAG: hypothetical protein ABSF80_10690 [Chitinispirillaceae bacterium]